MKIVRHTCLCLVGLAALTLTGNTVAQSAAPAANPPLRARRQPGPQTSPGRRPRSPIRPRWVSRRPASTRSTRA